MPVEYDEDGNGRWKLKEGEQAPVVVYCFPNGMCAVCELMSGKQVPELQRRTAESRELIRKAEDNGSIVVREWKQ